MKTLIALMLCSSIALADPPATHFATPSDAPLAADEPGVSVRLQKGDPAPFDGRELSLDENLRRGKETTDCKTTLADAQANGVLLPRAGVAVLISGAAAAVVTSIVLGIALASRK